MSEVVDLRAIEQPPSIATIGMAGALAIRETQCRVLVAEIRALREALIYARNALEDAPNVNAQWESDREAAHRRAAAILQRVTDGEQP